MATKSGRLKSRMSNIARSISRDSTTTKPVSSATAATNTATVSGLVQPAVVASTNISDTHARPPVKVSRPATSTGGADRLRDSRTRAAQIQAIAATTEVARNGLRHPNAVTNAPAASGPSANPAPKEVPSTLNAT